MFAPRPRRIVPAAVLGLAVALAAPPAVAEEALFTGPLSESWGVSEEFDFYWQAYRRGLAGDCEELLGIVANPVGYEAPLDLLARGEMYDRGVCVDFDPEAAFRDFQTVAELGFYPGPLLLGWKYAHGHGVARSIEAAHAEFKAALGFLARFPAADIAGIVARRLQDRPVPPALAEGLAWLRHMKANPQRMIAFALGLIDGTARYHDRTLYAADPDTAHGILTTTWEVPEAMYWLGIEALAGTFGPDEVEGGDFYLRLSARCGFVPAILVVAEAYERGAFGFPQSDFTAHTWYLVAGHYGVAVEEAVARVESWHPERREQARRGAGSTLDFNPCEDEAVE